MSKSALRKKNRGAYTSPFSGVGMEFYPLGVNPDLSGLVLHETGYIRQNDWWIFPNVLSPFWRLMYNFKKGHKVIFHHGEYQVTPDHIMLIPDQQLFNCYGTTSVPTFWMAFSINRRLHPNQKIPILLRPSTTEIELIRQITGFYSARPVTRSRSRIFHYSLALLNIVLNRPELRWLEHPVQNNILSTVRNIEDNASRQLTIPQLARMAGLSVRGFSKAFKRHQGITAAKFIARVRVREAAQLLANSRETVDAIAEKTGFPNRDYFSRVFKKITGESPGLFRQKHGIHST
ncbi:MAG: AraC family transcriptional regulator [Kiritimatiellae bacterium]|nr:AraC family transcriptional regulator [Kiritimatiellia bacterium]MDD5520516.1 AraC family transcriptional regulator [Kiritimatiellia bacterium]